MKLAYVTAITMLYKNTKAMLCSRDGDTVFFDIVTGVLQGDTYTLHLFLLYPDYVPRTFIDLINENGFTLKKQEVNDILQKL